MNCHGGQQRRHAIARKWSGGGSVGEQRGDLNCMDAFALGSNGTIEGSQAALHGQMGCAEALLTHVRRLAPALRERAAYTETLRRLPDETLEALRAAGVFRLLQPARFGGLELGFDVLLDVAMELG